jgi:hypothetical protein
MGPKIRKLTEPITLDETADALLQRAEKKLEAEWDRKLGCLNRVGASSSDR